jgi:hypothetical protein
MGFSDLLKKEIEKKKKEKEELLEKLKRSQNEEQENRPAKYVKLGELEKIREQEYFEKLEQVI